jgi:hypothetical protein
LRTPDRHERRDPPGRTGGDGLFCRVGRYLIKAATLRAVTSAAHAPDMRPWRADPVRRAGKPRRGGLSDSLPAADFAPDHAGADLNVP